MNSTEMQVFPEKNSNIPNPEGCYSIPIISYYDKHVKSLPLEDIFKGKVKIGDYNKASKIAVFIWVFLWLIGCFIFTYLALTNPEKITESPKNYTNEIEFDAQIKKDFSVIGAYPYIIFEDILNTKMSFSSPCELDIEYIEAFRMYSFNNIDEIDGCKVTIKISYDVNSGDNFYYLTLKLQNMFFLDYSKTLPLEEFKKYPDMILVSKIEKDFNNKIKVKKTEKRFSKVKQTNQANVYISPQSNYYYSISYRNAILTSIAFSIALLGIIQPITSLLFRILLFGCRKNSKLFNNIFYVNKEGDESIHFI